MHADFRLRAIYYDADRIVRERDVVKPRPKPLKINLGKYLAGLDVCY